MADKGGAKEFGFDTLAVHAGQRPDPVTGARAVPIYQTGAYVFEDADHAANLFALQRFGNIYSRIMNPTVAVFEERMAALENGIGALATASGQAAQFITLFTLMQAGDEFVSSSTLYGGSFQQFDVSFRKLGINARFVDASDLDSWRSAITDKTKCLYAEIMGNPKIDVLDIEGVAKIAHEAGVPLVVDNTFASPYLCRPLDWGRRHRRPLGDQVHLRPRHHDRRRDRRRRQVPLEQRQVPRHDRAVEGLPRPPLLRVLRRLRLADEGARRDAARLRAHDAAIRRLPPPPGPGDAPRRMDRHVANAQKVAEFLERHPAVEYVNYPGLPSNRYHELAKKYLPKGSGSIFTFGIKGGREAGKRCIEAVQLFSHVANVGDAKSLIIHPGSTTHQQLNDEELRAAGIGPEMIRISIGIESIEDILWDLEQALAKSQAAVPAAELAAKNGEGHSILSKAFGAPYQK